MQQLKCNMELLSLPFEMLEKISCFLAAKDLVSLSLTCKLLKKVSESDMVWCGMCYNTYHLKIPHTSAKMIYQKILHKFGHLIGLWYTHADCYGGLLQIKYSDGKLLGIELEPPKEPHLTQFLCEKLLFSIKLDENGDSLETCCINPLRPHGFTLHYGEKFISPSDERSGLYLTRQCAQGAESSDHQQSPDLAHELERWLNERIDFSDLTAVLRTRAQIIYKYMVLRQMDLKTHYSRLELPNAECNFKVPIQPGLFKGTYASHGIELIMLTYEDDRKAKATKITGDPNIPAKKISFRADLPFCMYLYPIQQLSYDSLAKIEASSSEVHWSDLPTTQPFKIPEDMEHSFPNLPDRCRARFHGFGQIAHEGFQNSEFIPGHWIVFNEDLFAFLWMDELKCFSFYHRVQEKL